MYIETSYPRTTGEYARISSPIIRVKSAKDNCRLRMFYHMYGKDVNQLKIYHRDSVGGKLYAIKTILGKVFKGLFLGINLLQVGSVLLALILWLVLCIFT